MSNNTYNKKVRVDGSRMLELDITCSASGDGNDSNFPILDIADFHSPWGINSTRISKVFKILEIDYAVSASVTIQLFWESGTGTHPLFAVLSAAHNEERKWDGGLTNNDVIAPTGRILMTTLGMDAVNDLLHLKFSIQKCRKTTNSGDLPVAGVENPQTGAGHSDGGTVGYPQGNPPADSLNRT